MNPYMGAALAVNLATVAVSTVSLFYRQLFYTSLLVREPRG